MFTFNYSIKMFDTDASGFLFFTSQMRMAHEAFEAFMASKDLGLSHILKSSDYLLPIVHAETDYKAPSQIGDDIEIQITAERIGTTSFTLFYRLMQAGSNLVGTARTVHVVIDKKTLDKKPLPDPIREAVQTLET